MEVQCLKVKIKTGCTDYVIDWMKGMQKKMNLVYEALAAETMVVEGIDGLSNDFLHFQ